MTTLTGIRKRKNISRSEFLDLALENLVDKGQSNLHLNALIDSLPVTSGSFYHHFRNKREFLAALIRHWGERHTEGIISELKSLPDDVPAQERLWHLISAIDRQRLTKWDRVIRGINIGDPGLSELVARVDRNRLAAVEQLFRDMGFSGEELLMRTRVFVIAMSQEYTLLITLPEPQREQYLRKLHAFFTRP